jgi:hypothetical protein
MIGSFCNERRGWPREAQRSAGRGKRVGIEDERDATVAEDRGGGDPGDSTMVQVKTLDDDLALLQDRVDD